MLNESAISIQEISADTAGVLYGVHVGAYTAVIISGTVSHSLSLSHSLLPLIALSLFQHVLKRYRTNQVSSQFSLGHLQFCGFHTSLKLQMLYGI